MLKRAFTYFLLIHLTGALALLPLSKRTHSGGTPPGQSDGSDRNTSVTAESVLVFDLLGNLLSGAVPHESKHPGDHLSDFFRIRKYTYRFMLWDGWFTRNLVVVGAFRPPFVRQHESAPFLGLVTLPDYYRLLFRLKPF